MTGAVQHAWGGNVWALTARPQIASKRVTERLMDVGHSGKIGITKNFKGRPVRVSGVALMTIITTKNTMVQRI